MPHVEVDQCSEVYVNDASSQRLGGVLVAFLGIDRSHVKTRTPTKGLGKPSGIMTTELFTTPKPGRRCFFVVWCAPAIFFCIYQELWALPRFPDLRSHAFSGVLLGGHQQHLEHRRGQNHSQIQESPEQNTYVRSTLHSRKPTYTRVEWHEWVVRQFSFGSHPVVLKGLSLSSG